jgi:hypothetical protein
LVQHNHLEPIDGVGEAINLTAQVKVVAVVVKEAQGVHHLIGAQQVIVGVPALS